MKKDFLAISDYSSDEIQMLLDLAVRLKKNDQQVKIGPFSRERRWQ